MKINRVLSVLLLVLVIGHGASSQSTTASMRLVAIADSAAPGIPGATYTSFFPPFISPDGHVVLAGKISGGGSTGGSNDALWMESNDSTLFLVAREGDQPAGVPDGIVISEPVDNFSPFMYQVQPPVADADGHLLFNARISGNATGTWFANAFGQTLVGYQNQPAPFYGDGRTFQRFDYATRMNKNGESLFLGGLQSPQVGVLWRAFLSDTLEVLDSTGMQLPGYPAFWVSGGNSNVVVNDGGSYASIRDIYYGTFKYGPGIFSNRGGSPAAVYTYLSDVPGASPADSFRFFDWLRINAAGHLAFFAMTVQEFGVNGRSGLWAEAGGSLELVTFLDVEAPGTPAGVKFLSFTQGGNSPEDIYYTDDDGVVFYARLTGTGVDATNDAGVWRKRGGALELLAREGDAVAGADSGVLFDTIERLLVNQRGDVVLFGTVKGPGITAANNRGFWGMDSLGQFASAVRTGAVLTIAPGVTRTFYQLFVGNATLGFPSTGADGRPAVFNDRRELAFQAWFLDSAIVRDAVLVANLNNLLPPLLTLEAPAGGELWRASGSDTIRWSHEVAGPVNILLSTEFDTATRTGAFDTIVVNYPADSGRYVWSIPDSIVSKKCAIVIHDASRPWIADTSALFRIKGYVLTRDSADQWERFRVKEDGWSFANSEDNMFPPAWWAQFDYKAGYDLFVPSPTPYPQDPDKPFHKTEKNYFPDWPSFVRAFGVGQCYLFLGPVSAVYRPSALRFWSLINERKDKDWNGSCFGFSISSLLAFDDSASYRARYTTMPPFDSLYAVPVDPATRNIINELWVHQLGRPHRGLLGAAYRTKTPSAFIDDLKAALGADTNDHPSLNFFSNDRKMPGGHSVVPYRAVRDTLIPGYWVYVYDNNHPGDENVRFAVDTIDNAGLGSWVNAAYPGWGGPRRILLTDPASAYLTTPGMPAGGPVLPPVGEPVAASAAMPDAPASTRPPEAITLYPSGGASVLITSDDGDSLGFADSTMVDDFPGASPLIALTGFPSAPYAYELPFGPIDVRTERFPDSLSTLTVVADSVIYTYARSGADSSQSDRFRFDGALAVTSGDPAAKVISVQAIVIVDDTLERVLAVQDLTLQPSDSLRVRAAGADTLAITTTGGASAYDLLIESASPSGNPRFRHDGVPLGATSTHLVVPQWTDLGAPVRIFIDDGNDGSIDDTLEVLTGVRDDRRTPGGVPAEFALDQNYPNPFNASTVIRYQLPVRSSVKLAVYDVYGRLVATLVDEIQEAGYRAVTWNPSNLASGTYLYRLSLTGVGDPAKSFTRTGRMVLLK